MKVIDLYCSVFHPTVVYSQPRAKRAARAEAGTRLPVEVRFRAMGRDFHFQLEPAAQPFTDMSHVLVRRSAARASRYYLAQHNSWHCYFNVSVYISGNETRIHGSLSGADGRQDCLQRGRSSQSAHTEKVALNFCGGIVSIYLATKSADCQVGTLRKKCKMIGVLSK